MNMIETVQRKYFPNFYESRFEARKRLAMSLKDTCRKNPSEIGLYDLKIILKVLQQFKLLPKELVLEEKEKKLKGKIVESSV